MTGLSNLTMSRYVDLVCGDDSVLSPLEGNKAEIERARARLIYEYTELSDSAAAAAYVSQAAQRAKRHAVLQVMRICHNLIEIGAFAEARDILSLYGITPSADDSALKVQVDAAAKRAQRDIDVEDSPVKEESRSPEEIRHGYDAQCASLMAYYKFQIDMDKIKASQFACLVGQARREIKERLAKIKRR